MDTALVNPEIPSGDVDMVVEDRERHLFRVARRAFTEQSVLEREHDTIFDRC